MTAGRAVAAVLIGAAGCAASPGQIASITAVAPSAIYSDVRFDLGITGVGFWAAYEIDTVGGSGNVDETAYRALLRPSDRDDPSSEAIAATSVGWFADTSLVAKMPAGIPAGVYDVEVRDPRGQTVVLPSGFASLGRDKESPVLTLGGLAPETLLGAGSEQDFRFQATDRLGWISAFRWRAWTDSGWTDEDDCPLMPPGPPGAPNECPVTRKLPDAAGAIDSLHLELTAEDSAQPEANVATLAVSFPFAPQPTVMPGACAPTVGPASGGTLFTITGTNFLPGPARSGTQIGIIDAAGETVLPQEEGGTSTRISAKTPPHTAGPVTVLVMNGKNIATACTFTFLAAPNIRQVKPGTGPAAGGTRVAIAGNHFPQNAVVYLIGDVQGELIDVAWVSDTRIEATMPPGAGVVAFVVDAGVPGRSATFTGFEYDPAPDVPPCPDPPSADCDPGSVP
jgi:IPT/TIG domain